VSKGSRRRNSSRTSARRSAVPTRTETTKRSPIDWYRRLDVVQKALSVSVSLAFLSSLAIGIVFTIGRIGDSGDLSSSREADPGANAATALAGKIEAVRSLRPLMTISQFEDRLGQPILRNRLPSGALESIFVDSDYYVQAIDDQEKVVFFSVTTRTERFSPVLGTDFEFVDHPGTVSIGKDSFADIVTAPRGVFIAIGAHNFAYYEVYYLANPGNYLTYVLGLNEAGLGGQEDAASAYFRFPVIEFDRAINKFELMPNVRNPWQAETALPEMSADLRLAFDEFRKTARVNTFGIGAPFLDFSRLQGARIGPNYNQVRVLD
jgi:hypothetical protein